MATAMRRRYSPQRLDMPEEMLTEIFEKLPVKSLLRFQSVCKYWSDIIQSPEFARQQLDYSNRGRRSKTNVGEKIFFQGLPKTQDPNSTKYIDCYVSDRLSIRYVESFACSSLHICSGDGLILAIQQPGDRMLLWNPSTSKIREIPPPPNTCPNTYITASGFGYDSNIQDYKVVTIPHHYVDCRSPPRLKAALIFTMKEYSWKTIETFPDCDSYEFVRSQITVFFQGAVHFLARPKLLGQHNNKYVILRVNLAEQRLVDEILSSPVPAVSRVDRCVFKIFEGRLSMHFHICKSQKVPYSFEVWTMMEYGNSNSWTQICSVPYFQPSPQALMQNGDLLVLKMMWTGEGEGEGEWKGRLFLQDKRDVNNELRVPEVMDSGGSVVYFPRMHTYWESLVAP